MDQSGAQQSIAQVPGMMAPKLTMVFTANLNKFMPFVVQGWLLAWPLADKGFPHQVRTRRPNSLWKDNKN